MKPAELSTPSDTEVQVQRSFDATAELVWQAYTEPELVKRWMLGPPGWSMPVCEMDVRIGGAYRWRWRSDEDGKEFGFYGEFQELEPHTKIVHTEYYGAGDLSTSDSQRRFTVFDRDNIAGFSLIVEVKLEPTSLELLQHFVHSLLDGRIVRAVASDEFLDNGTEGGRRQFLVWDTHRFSLPHGMPSTDHWLLASADSALSDDEVMRITRDSSLFTLHGVDFQGSVYYHSQTVSTIQGFLSEATGP